METQTWDYDNSSWGDLLTSFNDGTGNYTVTSDAAGNITSISNGTDSVSHTWLGRILQSATIVEDGVTTTATYTYNADGLRIKKVVGDSVTNYYYNGDILAGLSIDGVTMTFRYDENGVPFSFIYGETEYFYVRNLQGDVAYIVNDFGHIMGYYNYDAWGNVTELYGDIAEINPIRYRGYVYDTETGYYYLNSRYYDPELCRFISADDTDYLGANQTVGSYNLFSYCGNNPVFREDSGGTFFFTVLGGTIGAISGLVDSILFGEDPTTAVMAGLASGLISGAGLDLAVGLTISTGGAAIGVGVAIAFGSGALGGVVGTSISHNGDAELHEYFCAGFWGGVANVLSFFLAPINGQEVVRQGLTGATEVATQVAHECMKDVTYNMVTTYVCTRFAAWSARVSICNRPFWISMPE